MSQALDDLVELMRRLRDPVNGCPWDIKQDFRSIASCTLEEAYEVVEAIENDDMPHLCEELGDLLLQVLFYAQMAAEKGLFTIDDVARGETAKMVERHPHVFGDRAGVETPDDVLKNWEKDKAAKRAAEAQESALPHSVLDGISTALPAMVRALKIQKRLARVGFDWPAVPDVVAKIHEEMAELEAEVARHEAGDAQAHDALTDEFGDVLFALMNLADRLKIDPEKALRGTNRKVERRFRAIEARLIEQKKDISHTSLEEMDAIWQEVKKKERVG